jgi:hypothetical protein
MEVFSSMLPISEGSVQVRRSEEGSPRISTARPPYLYGVIGGLRIELGFRPAFSGVDHKTALGETGDLLCSE